MDYIIETRFQGSGYVAVPNYVAQHPDISADALGVLVWLASLPKGFATRRDTICKRFKFGKDKWQRVARDLQAVGALEVVTDRNQDGTFARRYVVQWPAVPTVAENPAPVPAMADNPPENCGKPAKTGRIIRPSIKTKDKKDAPEAREAAAPRAPASRAPVARPMGGGSGLASDVLSDAEKIRGLWSKAGVSASLGLRWYHPTEKQSYPASAYQQMAEKSGVFCDV